MPKPIMLASGIVEPGAGSPGAVVAFVAVNFGPAGSRLFKVAGPTTAPVVVELPGATTVDLGRFTRDLEQDLQPAVDAIVALGGTAAITRPSADWVCRQVRTHLKEHEGID
ncbi:MAG: hypothetical protein JRI68_09840, partial [Deltaproteobacteria bacterium]|nr:hypothetical protein [Deltaproteobacteria bacterium]